MSCTCVREGWLGDEVGPTRCGWWYAVVPKAWETTLLATAFHWTILVVLKVKGTLNHSLGIQNSKTSWGPGFVWNAFSQLRFAIFNEMVMWSSYRKVLQVSSALYWLFVEIRTKQSQYIYIYYIMLPLISTAMMCSPLNGTMWRLARSWHPVLAVEAACRVWSLNSCKFRWRGVVKEPKNKGYIVLWFDEYKWI